MPQTSDSYIASKYICHTSEFELSVFFKGCGGYHTEMAGSFNSPNFPGTYPINSNCYYYITVTPGFVIRIIFKNFQTDSGFAFVKVSTF